MYTYIYSLLSEEFFGLATLRFASSGYSLSEEEEEDNTLTLWLIQFTHLFSLQKFYAAFVSTSVKGY